MSSMAMVMRLERLAPPAGDPPYVFVNPTSIAFMYAVESGSDVTIVRMHTGDQWAVRGCLPDVLDTWHEGLANRLHQVREG